ncbi:Rieske (2Fe-2S) protein [Streptomyces sp. FB2]|uniref:Rieske (2Fe-2S) protein n=1 Tax=Streptomyces sp. FB2 TaxID=2902454 RepID=UPI001F224A35|nr:Rieske (2Fe-2S) protein [Streptomyces sp. FB2]MCF2536759.1 Rieske (2Fe-2S) protein [Streptomyces sp. FB2]
MTNGPTRRDLLIATGTAGAAALAVGCGDSGDGDSSTSVSPGRSGGTPGQELTTTDDVPVGGGKIFSDEKVVVTQPEEGQFKAFSAICTHQQCLVSTVSDGTINCPCHGSKFKITDGAVANPPATRPLPPKNIVVEGNSIRLV